MRSECGDLEEVERVSLEERIDARLAIAAISGVSLPARRRSLAEGDGDDVGRQEKPTGRKPARA